MSRDASLQAAKLAAETAKNSVDSAITALAPHVEARGGEFNDISASLQADSNALGALIATLEQALSR